jgi:predicted TIM-barrel fold metal-dependent hydrolase
MPVVDADSHLQPPYAWFERTYPDLADELPPPELRVYGPIAGVLPPELLPADPLAILAPAWRPLASAMRVAVSSGRDVNMMIEHGEVDLTGLERLFHGPGRWDDPAGRVAVLDRMGIDHQLISGIHPPVAPDADPPARRRVRELVNTINAEQLSGYTDRLLPIAVIDLEDLDWSIVEMTRMRALGSRAFHLPPYPAGDRSLSHPHFDRLWAAASDLGMLAYLHVFGEAFDPAWANNGGDYLSLAMLTAVRYHHTAEMVTTVLVGGGVFARFPKLGMVMAEIGGLQWLANCLQWMDATAHDPMLHLLNGIEEWRYPLPPSDYVRRQLRVTPLPNASQSPAPLLDQLGEVAVFSSDYPHPEGSPNPAVQDVDAATDHYRGVLASVDETRRRRFMGDSLADLFARTGDPLTRTR